MSKNNNAVASLPEPNDDWVTEFVNAFYEMGKQAAKAWIPDHLTAVVSAGTAANSAIFAAVCVFKDRNEEPSDADEFELVLRVFAQRKVVNRIRYHLAAKRSRNLTIPLCDEAHAPTSPKEPACELYGLVENELRRMHGSGRRFRISQLGILGGYTAKEVGKLLSDEYPKAKILKLRAMQIRLREDRQRLQRFIRDLGGFDEFVVE